MMLTRLKLCAVFTFGIILASCSDKPAPVEEITPRVKYFVVGEQATGQSRRISGKIVAADT